jgi:hypothetical protein
MAAASGGSNPCSPAEEPFSVTEGKALNARTGQSRKMLSLRGTDGSNPSPSSRQSVSLPQPLSKVENPAFRAGLGSWLGDRVSRDAPGFPLRANRRQYLCRAIFQYRSAADVVGEVPRSQQSWVFSGLNVRGSLNSDRAQAKPSRVRWSCQASGRRECSRSFSDVKSRGCRPSRIAWVISGAR